MNKILVWAVLLIGVGAGAYYYYQKADAAEQAKSAYKITEIKTGMIEDTITSQGKLEAKEYVDVGTQVSGQLQKLHVDLGDVVKKGDLIAEIDPKIYESQVQATQARLKTLAAQRDEQAALVTQAQQKFNRNLSLFKADAIAKELFEDAQTALNVAKAQLASIDSQIEEANSSLDEAQTNLGYTKIYAPMDGTVVSQTSREGQTLNANQSAPVIVQIANLDVMTVRAQVAEADIQKISVGMPVYFTVLGSQDRKWNAKVRQILPTPDTVNDVVLYNVLIDVENKDRQLMINMSTQMFFSVGRAENVPVIPVSALGKRVADKDTDSSQAYMVKVMENGKPVEKIVQIGLMDRVNAEIKSGLKPGDKVAEAAMAAGNNGEKKTRSGPPIRL